MSPWLEGDTFGGHLYPPPPRGEVEIRIGLMALVSAMTDSVLKLPISTEDAIILIFVFLQDIYLFKY